MAAGPAKEDRSGPGVGLIASGAVVAVLIAVVFAVTQLSDGDEPVAPTPTEATADVDQEAVNLFADSCGRCHTLEAAGTNGEVGPNLDEQVYSAEDVLTAIETGAGGSGVMPANLLEGEDARRVAELIAE